MTLIAFPGHAGRMWPLARWRSLARIGSQRSLLIAAAVLAAQGAIIVPARPAAAQAGPCTFHQTPPPTPTSPDGRPGFVLWSPPQAGSTTPNTLIGFLGDNIGGLDDCATATTNTPSYIAIAQGVALVFFGLSEEPNVNQGVSPWGSLNVPAGSGPTDIAPARAQVGWTLTTSVWARDPASVASSYTSCRRCDLSNINLELFSPLNIDDRPDPVVNFAGDVTGATFVGTTITGTPNFYNFDGADLSGATFNGASLQDAHFGTVTADRTTFPGSNLWGATFDKLEFQVPPSFAGAQLGGDVGQRCTAIANTNLVHVSFTGVAWQPGCTGAMFPASQLPLRTVGQILVDDTNGKATVDFTGATMVASSADRAALAGADLRNTKLAGVTALGEPFDLTGTHLDGATLTGSNLALADLTAATLTNVSAAGTSFEGADLSPEGSHPGANFSGANTNLRGANFTDANVSGASFVGADLTGAAFSGARGVDTDFTGVRARDAVFSDAHLYGNGQAFHQATDLHNIDFTGAVLAGDAGESGGFDLTGADLTGAHFDDAVCVSCNLTNATLDDATFTGAYLPGVGLSGARLSGANFDRAWLYCGSLANDHCAKAPGSQPLWAWPLALGTGETYGPVPFGATDLNGVDLAVVSTCPDGKSGAIAPAGCPQAHLLPSPAEQPVLPAPCSASAYGGCPTATSTLFQSSSFGDPLAVVAAVPPTWNTALSTEGYYVAFDDATVRRVSAEAPVVVAGASNTTCADRTSPCGDGGPATAAQLAQPNGLAVGLDGSLYIADVLLRKVRKVDPSGVITTVAGTGVQCDGGICGDGGPATSAPLAQPFGVTVDPYGVLLIADGFKGVRRVAVDGTISTLTPGGSGDTYWSVATGADGTIYAAIQFPDRIVKIDAATGAVTRVVGTGTSGYNGNTNGFGMLMPGTDVEINQPSGLSVDLDGNVIFADTANHLIRAYVPSSGNVIDDLAGVITNGAPTGGFNGDGQWADETQLRAPLGVTATRGPLLVIADTNNQRVRQVGPAPLETAEAPRPPEVVVSCATDAAWTCERVPKPAEVGAAANLGSVTISHNGVEFAAGRWLAPVDGRVRFLLFEQVPLVPGTYELGFGLAGRGFRRTIQLTQGL